MGIRPIFSGGGDFKPCPEGVFSAVCVDVVDGGVKDSGFKNKDGSPKMVHKVRIVWQVNRRMETGKRFMVNCWYNNSLGIYQGKRSNLLKALETWRGREYTESELADMEASGWELDSVVGKHCLLQVIHNTTPKGTYANVSTIMPLPDGMEAIQPEDYVRKADRPIEQTSQIEQGADDFGGFAPADDSDIPF